MESDGSTSTFGRGFLAAAGSSCSSGRRSWPKGVGPLLDGTRYTQADAWDSMIAVGMLPALMGLPFLVWAARSARRR